MKRGKNLISIIHTQKYYTKIIMKNTTTCIKDKSQNYNVEPKKKNCKSTHVI